MVIIFSPTVILNVPRQSNKLSDKTLVMQKLKRACRDSNNRKHPIFYDSLYKLIF